MKLSIVLSTQPASFSALAYKGELETNLAKIAALGYDGVELAVRDPKLLEIKQVLDMVSGHRRSPPSVPDRRMLKKGFLLPIRMTKSGNRRSNELSVKLALQKTFGLWSSWGLSEVKSKLPFPRNKRETGWSKRCKHVQTMLKVRMFNWPWSR